MRRWHVSLMVDGRQYRWTFDQANLAAYCYANAILAGFLTVRVREVRAREHERVSV